MNVAGPFAAWTNVPTAERPTSSIWLYDSRTATALRLSDSDSDAAFHLTRTHLLWTDTAQADEGIPHPDTLHLLPLAVLSS